MPSRASRPDSRKQLRILALLGFAFAAGCGRQSAETPRAGAAADTAPAAAEAPLPPPPSHSPPPTAR